MPRMEERGVSGHFQPVFYLVTTLGIAPDFSFRKVCADGGLSDVMPDASVEWIRA